jgi:chorismate lyase / 3-hydroxybenzoate synthase
MLRDPARRPLLESTYATLDPGKPLDDDVLAAVVYGREAPCAHDLRCVRIDLAPLAGTAHAEVWRGTGPVRMGTAGPIRYVENGECFAGWLSISEDRFGGLIEAAEAAYLGLLGLHAQSPYRHVWRIWNFITAINEGDGDGERYRQFCLGRARAYAAAPGRPPGVAYPAASAVGKTGLERSLDIYWFAGREPGTAVENPRQVSAYHYPRRYGPAAPSFSRAMKVPAPMLFVSGTASIIGHESVHPGDVEAQLRETLVNLETLLRRAQAGGRIGSARLGPDSLVKAYLRPGCDAALVERALRRELGERVPLQLLSADICRADLLIELEVAHAG